MAFCVLVNIKVYDELQVFSVFCYTCIVKIAVFKPQCRKHKWTCSANSKAYKSIVAIRWCGSGFILLAWLKFAVKKMCQE